MPKNNASSFFRESFSQEDKTQQSLRAYFGNVVTGQPHVFDTPFANGESTDHLLQSWLDVLESVRHKWPSLWNFEIDLAEKVGPMSVRLPLKDRMQDIDDYYKGVRLPSNPIDHRAINCVQREFSKFSGLEVRRQNETIALMKKSTNSGSPYFTKRKDVVSNTYACNVYAWRGEWFHQILGMPRFKYLSDPVDLDWHQDSYQFCAVLGWRGQEGGRSKEDVKQRVVWMFPFSVNICELQVYQPLIELSQRYNVVPAWVSMEAVDERITQLFDSKADSELVVCTDFSKFDQHFNENLQSAAYSVISNMLTPGKRSRWWLNDVFPIKYVIPIAYDYGKVKFGKHGMASGSGGTNCDETLAHRALQYEAAMKNGSMLNVNSQCLGDDGILTYPGITVDDVVESYKSHGLEMNPDKQYASTQDCVYLRRWHHKDYRERGVCVGVYSTCRALGRLRYLERWMNPEVWDERAVALRQLSILENVKYHPLKAKFVDFCMERDKYRLGIDIPNFLDNIERLAREKIDAMPDFMGYTKTLQSEGDPVRGINNWWIVRYLKSKA